MEKEPRYYGNSKNDLIYKLNYPIIIWMVIIHGLAIWGLTVATWELFFVAVGMNLVAGCLGITLCYHRLLSHRSYALPKWLERIFTVCGVLALQGGPTEWVGKHRMHHAGSDTDKDPHDASRGFWFSHLWWMLIYRFHIDSPRVYKKFARDIQSDPFYRWLDRPWNQVSLQVGAAGILFLFGGYTWILWGIFVRLVLTYHCTWFVNSWTHLWGYRSYDVDDLSRNNFFVAFLTWGEGWHNNHHAHPDLAPAGHRWWEFDFTYGIIKILKWLGLASKIKTLPTVSPKGQSVTGVRPARIRA